MTTEQNLGPERLSLLACSPVPGAGTSLGGERRAREISKSKEATRTENGRQRSESASIRKEADQVVCKGNRRGKYRPRELRIKLRDRVIELRQQGRSYNEIRAAIKQEFGIELSKSQISEWVRGIHDPYNGRRIPSLELLEPSEDLAYVIGVLCGDGSAWEKSRMHKGYRRVVIYLEAKDREFVEEFAIRISRVLNRPPPKVNVKSRGHYYVEVKSKTLYELLKKPIDLDTLRKFVEHCEKCMAMFLMGLFDSEGSVSEKGYIVIYNSNYELLLYVQELLKKFGIETTGPWPNTRQGAPLYNPKNKKVYTRKKDCFYLRILASSNADFYQIVGFTILRKRVRLEAYLRRRGILLPIP
jgi:intein-encoded DNA endonuclease-like protein